MGPCRHSGRQSPRGNCRRAREDAPRPLTTPSPKPARRWPRRSAANLPRVPTIGSSRPKAARERSMQTSGPSWTTTHACDLRRCSARQDLTGHRRSDPDRAARAVSAAGPGRQHGGPPRMRPSTLRSLSCAIPRRARRRLSRERRRLARNSGVLHELSQRGCALHCPATSHRRGRVIETKTTDLGERSLRRRNPCMSLSRS